MIGSSGDGYGDGRAISIGEVVVRTTNGTNRLDDRWELQLKGSGRTPFCRGADGRAVLRSSVRELIASEAMHAMGVSSTRALSLVVSEQETAQRPWYSQNRSTPPDMEHGGDLMQAEPVAMVCRVARSFMRVGESTVWLPPSLWLFGSLAT